MEAHHVINSRAAPQADARSGAAAVQFWVTVTRSPEFAAQVRKQCQSLKGDSAEADVLRFAEEAASQVEGWE